MGLLARLKGDHDDRIASEDEIRNNPPTPMSLTEIEDALGWDR